MLHIFTSIGTKFNMTNVNERSTDTVYREETATWEDEVRDFIRNNYVIFKVTTHDITLLFNGHYDRFNHDAYPY